MPLQSLLRSSEWYGKAAATELAFAQYTGGNCLGYEQVTVNDIGAIALPNVPNSFESQTAYKALIVVEADPTSTDTNRVVRFREDAVDPTDALGMPLGHLSIYEVGGLANLTNFRIIGIEAGKTHTLNIVYYG